MLLFYGHFCAQDRLNWPGQAISKVNEAPKKFCIEVNKINIIAKTAELAFVLTYQSLFLIFQPQNKILSMTCKSDISEY